MELVKGNFTRFRLFLPSSKRQELVWSPIVAFANASLLFYHFRLVRIDSATPSQVSFTSENFAFTKRTDEPRPSHSDGWRPPFLTEYRKLVVVSGSYYRRFITQYFPLFVNSRRMGPTRSFGQIKYKLSPLLYPPLVTSAFGPDRNHDALGDGKANMRRDVVVTNDAGRLFAFEFRLRKHVTFTLPPLIENVLTAYVNRPFSLKDGRTSRAKFRYCSGVYRLSSMMILAFLPKTS